jgi:hypothetical protein
LQAVEVVRATFETLLNFITLNRKEIFVELRNQDRIFTVAMQNDLGLWKMSVNPKMYLGFVGGFDAVKHARSGAAVIYAHEVLFREIGFIDSGT